ncbi:MAG: flagellar biosynthesis protein FliQ [Alphaproteobacteria bacterium]
MNEVQALEIGRDALWVTIKIATPVMLIALFAGLVVALFQALTQIQEMTLAFVPKIIVIFLSMFLLLPFMYQTLATFTLALVDRIITGG